MPKVYNAISESGAFVAFWQEDEGTIAFFTPESQLQEEYFEKHLKDVPQSIKEQHSDTPHDDYIAVAAKYFLEDLFIPIKIVNIEKRQDSTPPGRYFPRMWRGCEQNKIFGYNPINPRDQYGYRHTQSVVAAASLFNYLSDIFRHIEPSTENFQTFGHKIRELIILACTEIESGWKAVIRENTNESLWKNRYNTADYVHLNKPLHLSEWVVEIEDYPNLSPIRPFALWDVTHPTRSLPWYNAYNLIKHDRESDLSRANLENLLNSMAALFIMQIAQWGPQVYSILHDNRTSPFNIVESAKFSASEYYMPMLDRTNRFEPLKYFR